MKNVTWSISVPGQLTGEARVTGYLLDAISVSQKKLRPAVIILPGGGYCRRSDREGEPVAVQYLAMGYHAFILHYSVSPNRFPVALQEVAQAIADIREHATAWNIDPDQILVCGFSAGGHLAGSIGTFWNRDIAYEAIGRTAAQIRPNGLILCYPVISTGEFCHKGSFLHLLGENPDQGHLQQVSLEHQVSGDMPPVFLWHTLTDQSVPVENSFLLAAAMRRQQVSFELHIYPEGVHGLSLANEETGGADDSLVVPCCQSWISLVKSWIETKFNGGQNLVKS
ncbi:MAG: alpha/beta hydrolase [Lachnospiraceae bacterium]